MNSYFMEWNLEQKIYANLEESESKTEKFFLAIAYLPKNKTLLLKEKNCLFLIVPF